MRQAGSFTWNWLELCADVGEPAVRPDWSSCSDGDEQNARPAIPKQAEAVLATGNQRSTPSALTAILGGAEQPASRPEYEAQDLIYDAWEATGTRRAALARRALGLWPDCADAYVLLAQTAPNLEQTRELLERGVAAG